MKHIAKRRARARRPFPICITPFRKGVANRRNTTASLRQLYHTAQKSQYEVRHGKHLSFRAPEQKNFTYIKSLGNYYSEENVRIRLAKNRNKVKTPRHLSREARLYINISTYVTTGNREGFERWAKLNNLK